MLCALREELTSFFLSRDVNGGRGSAEIPVSDQHTALCLLLELATQRGSLSHLLDAVLLLVNLWDKGKYEVDNR